MSQGKQIKKCKENYNVYIPPPARKAENIFQDVNKKQESKDKKVVKVRSGEKEVVDKKTFPSEVEFGGSQCSSSSPVKESVKKSETGFVKSGCSKELPVTLNLRDLSIACDDDRKTREKHCHENQSENSKISIVKASKDSDCMCTDSNVLNISENAKDISFKQTIVKADIHKLTCQKPLETDENATLPPNNKLNPEEENRIFRSLWVKLCDHENLDSKTSKSHNIHKGNDIYGDREINENCILEIYDFPAEFKTSDLREIFSSYITRGMKIRWVDDTHALGIYPSEIIAYEVLNTDLPNLKTRILNEGIQQSKDKAKLLLPPPPPPRPKTCSASARRMVSGALGIKAVFTQAEIEEERQLLQVAREQKLLAAKQRAERILKT